MNKLLMVTVLPILMISGCSGFGLETPTAEVFPTDTLVPTQIYTMETEEPYIFKTSQPGFFTVNMEILIP